MALYQLHPRAIRTLGIHYISPIRKLGFHGDPKRWNKWVETQEGVNLYWMTERELDAIGSTRGDTGELEELSLIPGQGTVWAVPNAKRVDPYLIPGSQRVVHRQYAASPMFDALALWGGVVWPL